MANQTNNHGLNRPAEGTTDWHIPLNENFEKLDADVEIRDTAANMGNYTPKQGAKFFATDTREVYLGDGSQWVPSHVLPNVVVSDTVPDSVPPNSFVFLTSDGGGTLSNVVEDFERTDPLAPYSGDVSAFAVDSNTTFNGTQALTASGGSSRNVISRTDVTVSAGNRYAARFYSGSSTTDVDCGLMLFMQSATGAANASGYKFAFTDAPSSNAHRLRIEEFTDGSLTVHESVNVDIPDDSWFVGYVDVPSAGEVTYTVVDVASGTTVGELSHDAFDRDYNSGGVGWFAWDGLYGDYLTLE